MWAMQNTFSNSLSDFSLDSISSGFKIKFIGEQQLVFSGLIQSAEIILKNDPH